MVQILDGTGGGFAAEVQSDNRLATSAITLSTEVHANEEGDAYNINSGYVTLTNATDTPIMYILNNEDKDLVIQALAIGIGPSTSGTGIGPRITVQRNPTGGTIISSTPTNVAINSNRNYGSSKTLNVTAYVGATGDTLTGGVDHLTILASANARAFITINEILPKGTSIGVFCEAQASNSSMAIYVAAIVYLASEH